MFEQQRPTSRPPHRRIHSPFRDKVCVLQALRQASSQVRTLPLRLHSKPGPGDSRVLSQYKRGRFGLATRQGHTQRMPNGALIRRPRPRGLNKLGLAAHEQLPGGVGPRHPPPNPCAQLAQDPERAPWLRAALATTAIRNALSLRTARCMNSPHSSHPGLPPLPIGIGRASQ